MAVQMRNFGSTARRPGVLAGLALALLSVGCGPRDVSLLAVHRDHEGLHGRYMGGGQHFGQARYRDEGAWANDWHGMDLLKLIELRWSHSQSFKREGLGSY